MKLTYDLHTHILPGVDDGAKTTEEAMQLIEALRSQGVSNICLTPHFYSHKESTADFLSRRDEAAKQFLPLVPDDVTIRLGAEVFVTKYLFSDDNDLCSLCIQGTPYMLTEFSYDSRFGDSTIRQIEEIRSRGIIPVLPHVERYPVLMKNKHILEDLIYMGIIIQSNAISFSETFLKRKLSKMINSGHIQVLSTDTHSMRRNPPQSLSLAVDYLSKKYDDDIIRKLESNAKDLFV